MAAGAREPFRVVSCETGVVWTITGIARSSTPHRVWVELEHTVSPPMAVAELFARLAIPFDASAGEGCAP